MNGHGASGGYHDEKRYTVRQAGPETQRSQSSRTDWSERFCAALVALDLELPALQGVSEAQIRFGEDVRARAVVEIGDAVRQLLELGLAEEDALKAATRLITEGAAREARHWLAHRRRIEKKREAPPDYWLDAMRRLGSDVCAGDNPPASCPT
jgi:hypothetical protein